MGIIKKGWDCLEKVVFTKEEQEKNERYYLNIEREIKEAKERLSLAYSLRRCRVCGEKHFSAGYCITCYLRKRNGEPLGEKGATGKSLSKRGRTLASLYERVTGERPSDGLDLVAWFEGLFVLIEERYSQAATMYFVDGLTYREIGERLSLNHQVVNKRVCLFIKEAKKITKR